LLTPERKWIYRKRAEVAVAALRRNKFEADFCEDRAEALDHIVGAISEGAVIGFGDSLTLRELSIYEALRAHSCELINPPDVQDKLSAEEKRDLRLDCFRCDVYLSGANAITLDGKIVNVDGIGNRVAPTIFGPPKVIIVAGANKLTEDFDGAMCRVKQWAGPMHAWRDGYNTPCGHTGVCNDCRSPEWMCRSVVVLQGPSKQTETSVVIIGEQLGL
jgi:hypothetical protein